MNQKEKFVQQIEENIESLSPNEMKTLIIEVSKVVPSSLHQHFLCIVKKINNNLDEDNILLDEIKQEIYDNFKEIENGNICLRCYSYESSIYNYYGPEMDFEYFLTAELNHILNKSFNYIKNAIWHKKYVDAIEILDLLLTADYMCEEVGNPEYDDSNEVYDCFERNINDFKVSLDFDLNELLLYGIYSVILIDFSNKNEMIYNYTKYGTIDIARVKNIGIEEIENFDEFYAEWIKFLENKKEK